MAEHDVVIVGSGMAGLTAARDLSDRGVSALVVEARDRIGGRTYSRALEGHPDVMIEIGGTYVHPTHQHNIAREMQRYSLPLTFGQGTLTNSCFVIGGQRHLGLPIPVEELAFVEKAITRMVDAGRRISAAVPYDRQNIADLDVGFDEFFAPVEMPEASREFVRGFIGQTLQSDPERFSMLMVLPWVEAFGSFTEAFFGIAGEKLENGMSALTGALCDDAGPDLLLDSPVTAVVETGDGVEVKTAAGESHLARACIIAMPSNLLRGIEFSPGLSESKQRALAPEYEYLVPGFKTFLVVENAVPGMIGYAGMGGDAEPRIGWLYEEQDLGDGKTLLVVWGRGPGFGGDLAEAEQALSAYMPGVKVLAMDGHDWAGDPLAGGMVRMCAPGQCRTFASTMTTPEGRIAFAGSDTSTTTWVGWIEGAVASGHVAAGNAIEIIERS